jgi:hypothetical protein
MSGPLLFPGFKITAKVFKRIKDYAKNRNQPDL